jgi:hypothetical protein
MRSVALPWRLLGGVLIEESITYTRGLYIWLARTPPGFRVPVADFCILRGRGHMRPQAMLLSGHMAAIAAASRRRVLLTRDVVWWRRCTPRQYDCAEVGLRAPTPPPRHRPRYARPSGKKASGARRPSGTLVGVLLDRRTGVALP